VSFPTETVYGLGANAMDESACQSIFAAKERPLTDPLIVHVTNNDSAYALWRACSDTATTKYNLEQTILEQLCEKFWPGPLTIVAKASTQVPLVIMAGTGFVACRNPNHEIARAVIESAGIPIAAPSANKFGHVSPTTANHVWDDLRAEDIWIVDVENSNGGEGVSKDSLATRGSCNVGVESSVVKLEMIPGGKARIAMLRQGAVSVDQLESCLVDGEAVDMQNVELVSKFKNVVSEDESSVSPGQTIRHYSPNVPSFLLSQKCIGTLAELSGKHRQVLSRAVVIDYGQQLAATEQVALDYRDLSTCGDSSEAAKSVFETLRWAELVEGSRVIVFPDLQPSSSDALALAVKDRLTRAASGNTVDELTESLLSSSTA